MSIANAANRLAHALHANGDKIVFAESCTGGLASGSLTRVAGISAHHCGGMVTYRNETKMAYLGIAADILADPGPVSDEVAELMAKGVLERTPEATLAAAVTGHLGPHAPPEFDGIVFLHVERRSDDSGNATQFRARLELRDVPTRAERQDDAVEALLRLAISAIQMPTLPE